MIPPTASSLHLCDRLDRLLATHAWDEAVVEIDGRLNETPRDVALLRRRRMALAIGGNRDAARADAALATARRVVALSPADALDHQHLAHILLRCGHFEAALAAAEWANRLDPTLIRPYAVAIAAVAMAPRLSGRLAWVAADHSTTASSSRCNDLSASAPSSALTVAIPWNLPPYRAYSGAHPIITSALRKGARLRPRWAMATAPMEPWRALPLLDRLTCWAARLDLVGRQALADFLIHRLPLTFYARPSADLTFHHTVPFGVDGGPWVMHFENFNMLFAPMNGYPTTIVHRSDPQVGVLRCLLSEDSCLGVITHIRATKRLLDQLFDDPQISAKTVYCRFGIDLQRERPRLGMPAIHRTVKYLLFTNSLARDNFFIRGGPDVIAAFMALSRGRDDLRLIMRTGLPETGAQEQLRRARRHSGIVWLTEHLSDSEIDALYGQADLFLLPSGVLHAVSLVRALRAGLGVVASDALGVSEFIRHGVNGLVVPGRRIRVSPQTEEAVFAEDLRPLIRPSALPVDPRFYYRFRSAIAFMLDHPAALERIRRNARMGANRDHREERWGAAVSSFIEERWRVMQPSVRPKAKQS